MHSERRTQIIILKILVPVGMFLTSIDDVYLHHTLKRWPAQLFYEVFERFFDIWKGKCGRILGVNLYALVKGTLTRKANILRVIDETPHVFLCDCNDKLHLCSEIYCKFLNICYNKFTSYYRRVHYRFCFVSNVQQSADK